MRNPILVIAAFLLLSTTISAQQDLPILLKNGSIQPGRNIDRETINLFNQGVEQFAGKRFAVIQFRQIPSAEERKILEQAGISLLEYIPNNAWSVSIAKNIDLNDFVRTGVLSLVELTGKQKMHPALLKIFPPAHAVKSAGTVDLWISVPSTMTIAEVYGELVKRNIEILPSNYKQYGIIAIRVAVNQVESIAQLGFVQYVQPTPPEDQPINNMSRTNARANILNASPSVGGRNLRGEGVVVGIGDDSDPQTHVDFTGRIINNAPIAYRYHGTHVSGITGGGGIKNELHAGFAPKSTLISHVFSGIFSNAAAYVQDHGMVITNNSYGAIIGDCSYNGLYDLYSRVLDQQAFELPNLQHVFAAGNSGYNTCPPYPTGFRAVLGSYQSAKNVLTVGNAYGDGVLFPQSSRGPVQDGRIKPEISATGSFIQSTVPPNSSYGNNTGTSMAAPSASGGLALIYQRYRQLNGGANPPSALIKALIANGGRDQGNEGPDFSQGFGWMNLLRSVEMLENNRYFVSTLNHGSNNTHNITVPANSAQLKVMLYWHDPAANVVASKTLVNDLDLEVRDAGNALTLPRILDTSATNLLNIATTGADHINNIEQVTISNPAAGNYTVTVRGTAITTNPPQQYFVVYDFLPIETRLTNPIGGEKFIPGETILISWDSYGAPSNNFTIQYSSDSGNNWIDINTNVPSTSHYINWVIPNVMSERVLVRIERNGTLLSDTSFAFTISPAPTVSLSAIQCEGYVSVDWTAVAGATDYEVMMLRGDEMVSVTTTNSLTYSIGGLPGDSVCWVTVRARLNGKPGRRGIAVSRVPNNGTCSGTISDNDLKMDALVAPVSGRKFTSTELSPASVITARIKNLDDVAVNSFTMQYSVNGGGWVSELVNTPVAGGATYTHTFAGTLDLSAVGQTVIRIVVKNTSADPVVRNDTLVQIIKHLDNQPINLTTAFVDNFESAVSKSYLRATIGIDGIDRYDFSNNSAVGRLRTFLNSGMAYSGSKALTLDADRYYPAGNVNFVAGTYSLATYNAASNDLRLQFRFNNHGQTANSNNRVWIRGNDTQPWIEVYNLDINLDDPGSYKLSSSIEMADFLVANGQNFSTSFQVRLGQWGQLLAGDLETGQGYTFDDLRLYEVFDDMQMIAIDTPVVSSCGLSNSTPVRIRVRNSANTTINNIPVRYRVNGGSIVNDVIPSIAGNTTVSFTFSTSANLSAVGNYNIETWTDLPTDSYRDNDTVRTTITNSPVINSFPHLETFESSNGMWYPGGKKSTWEYGTPASNKIKKAASGTRAWKTRLTGNYNDQEKSYLYSPCFDITGMTNPTLSFSLALDLEDCGADLCDGAWVEYSADGVTWTTLGGTGTGTNWYNKNYSGNAMWSVQNYTRWHVATHALPTGLNNLRLRFVIQSDPYVNKEGIAIDDIHVYDNTNGIYDGVTMASPVTQNINGGNTWVDFTTGGKLVASIKPNNQNLGSTDIQAFIHQGNARNDNGQYYHNRNLTIKPANTTLSDSVTVRFYFLDTETDSLVFAYGCVTCTKPSSAYELGVSKYNDINDAIENGSVADNVDGVWTFTLPSMVNKVPFNKGYYAEFKVSNFSEFWLNDGGPDDNRPLPVNLISFKATKQGQNVFVEWKTDAEFNVQKFEIEVARGNGQYQTNLFDKIGEVLSAGNSSSGFEYSFTDTEPGKTGVRFYRLKIIDIDGSFRYSLIRPVVFNAAIEWNVFPNPSAGEFNIGFQLPEGEILKTRVFDLKGALIREDSRPATGFQQKLKIDLSSPTISAGIYMLEVTGIDEKRVFKLVKN